MGETTGISWCDHTFNPWIGCTKVSQGCKFCYAETQNKRYNWTAGWGPGQPRKRTSAENWKKPIQWAKNAVKDGVIRRVFCASLADVFDLEAPRGARFDLWELIHKCEVIRYEAPLALGKLEWLILTKRPENIEDMMPAVWLENPPPYIRLGVTCEDQENADKRIPVLLKVWRGKNFVSYEPAIGPLHMYGSYWPIDWIIVGGESGASCRPFDPEWARHIHWQCRNAGIPFFMKQLGGFPDKHHDPAEWPEDLRVQEFPEVRDAAL